MTLIPNFDTGSLTAPPKTTQAAAPNEVALRRAAAQFEALLLTQLTASLNPKEEEGEEGGLFSNSGGGMGIARQMYSEQLAKTMSESGGIGIADMLVAQVLKRNGQTLKNQLNPANERALSAARGIKNETVSNSDAKISLGSSKSTNVSPAGIDIAARSSNPPVETSKTTSSFAISSNPNQTAPGDLPVWGAGSAIGATRPRRVHAVEGNARVVNESAEVAKPDLRATASRHSRVAVPYVEFQSPLQGEIRSRFGMRRDPINGRMRLHQGIDIPAKRGTPIEAAAAGTVVFAGRNKGYGNMVMIEHADGRRTLYAHAQSLFVRVGDTVAAGESIAAVGSTGHSTGPHLHFEVREANRAVNPLSALSNEFAYARR